MRITGGATTCNYMKACNVGNNYPNTEKWLFTLYKDCHP